MKTKQEIKKWLLENAIDENGDLNLSGLDFSDFDGNVIINLMRVKNRLIQNWQHVGGDIMQDYQTSKKDLVQSYNQVGGDLFQNNQRVSGYTYLGDNDFNGIKKRNARQDWEIIKLKW